jgi:hypothetical protein
VEMLLKTEKKERKRKRKKILKEMEENLMQQ